jgi:hypothetical protein
LDDDALLDFRTRREALLQQRPGADDHAPENRSPHEIADELAWATLQAKIAQLRTNTAHTVPTTTPSSTDLANTLIALLGGSHADNSPAVIAPHLASIAGPAKDEPYLKKTREIRGLFKIETFRDSTITNAQLSPLIDPLPRSIWKKILLEEFVDFAKLFASMEQGYDHNDEAEDFAAGFAIVKKNHLSAKRPVRTEAEWIRVFGAWEAGVILIYPHRTAELQGYRRMVMDIFRATPSNPTAAINFDVEARDQYAKQPFHMDDRSRLHLPLLTQLFTTANASSTHSVSRKRAISPSSVTSTAKRTDVPCRNWNWGRCQDPCPNRRKHGTCCVCGEDHAAKENDTCLATLRSRAAEASNIVN